MIEFEKNSGPKVDEREVLTVPGDTEYILEQGVGKLALNGYRIMFTPESKFAPTINGYIPENFWAWPTGMIQGGYPPIASALEEHSDLAGPEGNIWARLLKSSRYIGAIAASNDAVEAGKVVRNFHRNVTGIDREGQKVHALNPKPYTVGWVTIAWLTEQSKRTFEPPESRKWWEEWYQESRVAYQCQGVSDRLLPEDYASYRTHFDKICEDELQRTHVIDEAYRRMLGDIDRPPQVHPLVWKHVPGIKRALSEYARLAGIGGLPPAARDAMELPWTTKDQRKFENLRDNYGRVTALIPRRMRTQPATALHVYPPEGPHHNVQMYLARKFYALDFKDSIPPISPNAVAPAAPETE